MSNSWLLGQGGKEKRGYNIKMVFQPCEKQRLSTTEAKVIKSGRKKRNWIQTGNWGSRHTGKEPHSRIFEDGIQEKSDKQKLRVGGEEGRKKLSPNMRLELTEKLLASRLRCWPKPLRSQKSLLQHP